MDAEGEESLFLRSKVLIDAKAAGIRYPISGMWGGDRDDLDGLRAWATALRNLGYYGMMISDPEHIPLVHEVSARRPRSSAYWQELDRLATEAEAKDSGPIVYGDPNQGEGYIVHIAHVGLGPQEPDLGTGPRPHLLTPPRPLLEQLVATSAAVAATPARSAKTAALVGLLGQLQGDKIEPAVAWLSGEPRQGKVGVGWATVFSVDVGHAAGAVVDHCRCRPGHRRGGPFGWPRGPPPCAMPGCPTCSAGRQTRPRGFAA